MCTAVGKVQPAQHLSCLAPPTTTTPHPTPPHPPPPSRLRRRPFLVKNLENVLMKFVMGMEFYDDDGRRKIAIGACNVMPPLPPLPLPLPLPPIMMAWCCVWRGFQRRCCWRRAAECCSAGCAAVAAPTAGAAAAAGAHELPPPSPPGPLRLQPWRGASA